MKQTILFLLAALLCVSLLACKAEPKQAEASPTPTQVPATDAPTEKPTEAPSATPTATPIATPTATPTAAPTDAPTATPTAKPTAKPTATAQPTIAPTMEPAEVTYWIKCVDQNGDAVARVTVTVCNDTICAPVRTGDSGSASYTGSPYAYEIHVVSVPDGYTISGSDTVTAPMWGGTVTFTFTKA
ncbi:MAG: hypothetical protein PHT58_07490 [Eubacteriales bacterium]|nr:hypothetical protein [Eubacteriales bacterium]